MGLPKRHNSEQIAFYSVETGRTLMPMNQLKKRFSVIRGASKKQPAISCMIACGRDSYLKAVERQCVPIIEGYLAYKDRNPIILLDVTERRFTSIGTRSSRRG